MDTGSADGFLRRFRDTGDPEALGGLFDATAPALFRVALRLAHDPASAEDALQETFLDLFDVARDWDPALPALPWLTGVLRHRIQRGRRKESRRPDARRLPPPPAPPEPSVAASAAEDRDRARRAMLDLEEPYRSVALLRWQYGLEPAEIAEVRGEPPGTVWSLLSRAKERLEKALTGTSALAVAFLPGAGLDAVRAKVVGSVAVKSAGVGTAVGGGLLVTKKAFVTVAALLICIGLGTTVTMMIPRGGFRGRVVDAATGEPVPGAKVSLPGVGVSPEETVTDADGRYALKGTGEAQRYVVVQAPGHVGLQRYIRAGDAGLLGLERGDDVSGRVLSPDGSPMARASVQIHARAWGVPPLSTATDANGRFRVPVVDRENYHNCVVRAEGYAKSVKDFYPAKDGPGPIDLGDFALGPERRVEGVILNGRGLPVPAMRLSMRGPLDLGRASQAGGMGESATSDDAGRFRFHGLAPGRYSINNWDTAFGTPRVEKECTIGDGDITGLELRYEHAGFLRVKVVDESGLPVPHVVIVEDGTGITAESGTDGIATLENLSPKRRIRPDVHRDRSSYVAMKSPEAVRPDGKEVTLVVRKAATIRGVVLDGSGDELEGASVSAFAPDGETWGGWEGWSGASTSTRGDGGFRLSVPEGATVEITARVNPQDDTVHARAKGVKAPADGLVLRLRKIPKTGRLTLRLLDPTGLPVAGTELWVSTGGERTVRTDAGGRVSLEGLPDEEIPIFVSLPARGPGAPWPLPEGAAFPPVIRILPDGREVDIRLLPGAEIRGTVLDLEGKPAVGAKVFATRPARWMSAQETTDAEGHFRIVVPAGDDPLFVLARLKIASDRVLRAQSDDIRPGATGLVLTLEDDD